MGKSNAGAAKRQRERDKERKKRMKAERRGQKKKSGGGIPIATVDEIQGGLMSIDEVVENNERGPSASGGRGRGVPTRLFVGGLDWRVDTSQLRALFEAIGTVTDAAVIEDRDTGDSRGFGFVTMSHHRDAAQAIEKLNGTDLEGRTLVVRAATERR